MRSDRISTDEIERRIAGLTPSTTTYTANELAAFQAGFEEARIKALEQIGVAAGARPESKP